MNKEIEPKSMEDLITDYILCLDIWNHEDSIRLYKEPLKKFLLKILKIWNEEKGSE